MARKKKPQTELAPRRSYPLDPEDTLDEADREAITRLTNELGERRASLSQRRRARVKRKASKLGKLAGIAGAGLALGWLVGKLH